MSPVAPHARAKFETMSPANVPPASFTLPAPLSWATVAPTRGRGLIARLTASVVGPPRDGEGDAVVDEAVEERRRRPRRGRQGVDGRRGRHAADVREAVVLLHALLDLGPQAERSPHLDVHPRRAPGPTIR